MDEEESDRTDFPDVNRPGGLREGVFLFGGESGPVWVFGFASSGLVESRFRRTIESDLVCQSGGRLGACSMASSGGTLAFSKCSSVGEGGSVGSSACPSIAGSSYNGDPMRGDGTGGSTPSARMSEIERYFRIGFVCESTLSLSTAVASLGLGTGSTLPV